MPQMQDEAGNIWEVDAAGNPVQLVSQAGQTAGPPVDPGYQYEGPKAQADAERARIGVQGDQVGIANTQSIIADRAADRARADAAERRAAEKAQRDRLEWEAQFNPDGTPKGTGDSATLASDSIAELDRLMQRIDAIKADADDNAGWFETGMSGGILRNTSGTAAYGLASDLKTLDANAAFRALQKMRDESPTGGALGQITEKELDLLKSTVANLDPNQPHGDFLNSLDRAKSYYANMRNKIVRDTPELAAQQNQSAPQNNPRDKQFSPTDDRLQAAQGERYSTPEDIAVAAKMQEVYNAGGGPKEMAAVAREFGRPVSLQQMQQWQEAADYRDGRGKYKGQRTGFSTVETPRSGRRGLAEQALGSLAATPLGTAGIGAGNAASFGGLDEIAGGINSVVKGTDYESERDYTNFAKQSAFEENPGSAFAGELIGGGLLGGAAAKYTPKLAAEALKNTRRAVGTGAAFGAIQGAGESNDNRLAGAAVGGGVGLASGAVGAKVVAPGLERLMRSAAGQSGSSAVRKAINKVRPNTVADSPNAPKFSKGENLLASGELDGAVNNLRDAQRLGLPYALADADPKLRQLAGSVARKSPNARELAEQTFEPRARGQSDRLVQSIDGQLAPVTDISARGSELMKAGSDSASPFYQKAYAQNALDDPDVSGMLNSPSGKDALKRAYRIAGDEGRDPAQMGFVYDEATGGVSVNSAGRYDRLNTQGNQLEGTTLQTARGGTVPKRGPTDLVGFLRLNGGLKDQSGELGHMGLTNAPRSGMDMVGREAQFGPLVNPEGMNFDDAALAAWEAGYFPDMPERPSVNQFLDAMRETQEGTARRFLPEDQASVDDFMARQSQNYQAGEANRSGGLWEDNSQPAGPRDFAPAEAYGREAPTPTYETLHMVKRGFDDVVEGSRDALGNLNLQGSPALQATNALRGRFNDRLKALNPDYAAGNAEFAKFAKRKDALEQGFNTLPKGNVPQRDFEGVLKRAQDYDNDFTQVEDRLVPELQRGYATNMADQADKMRSSANPFEAVYGSPLQREKVSQLFPEGAPDFDRTYNLERDMSKTNYETLGGSPTAARIASDGQFESGAAQFAGGLAADMAGGGGAFTTGNMLSNALRRGTQSLKDATILQGGQKKADAIAPALFETDPNASLDYLDGLLKRQAQMAGRKADFARRTGLFGAAVPTFAFGHQQ